MRDQDEAPGKSNHIAVDAVGERIRWALEQRGISGAELGRHLGVSRSAVSQWCSRRTPTSPQQKLERIADFLKLRVEWLRTGRGPPLQESCSLAVLNVRTPAEAPLDIIGVRVVGVAEGEVWREGGPILESTAAADRRIHLVNVTEPHRFAVEVRGGSANQTIRPGEYAICACYKEVRPTGPQRADLVLAIKRREGNEHKIFIARLHYHEDAWELHYESNDPRWQQERSIRLSKDLTHDMSDQCHIEIIGYVLGVFRAIPQPLCAM